ncbi:MAG: sulfotransferase [Mycobacteriaceae bacterium]|nr:sulfotransferase [Mycobacteriaceae bacterium]
MAERTDVGTVDDLLSSASRLVGLDDFGPDDDNYLEGLAVILESYQRDADLTPFGSKTCRVYLRGALAARLMAQAGWKEHPEYADVPVHRPIFVTGLPRTGTTALHRLLGADPAHQGLQLWLADFPQPRPPRETWSDNPVFARLNAQFEQHHVQNPEFMGLHFMSADEVEECWQLLRQSLHAVAYETLAHLPTYARWLDVQDWTPAYRRYRKNLQLIGLNDVPKRWVLKNPSHLHALDALMATFPDALVVQCHRPAETLMASACSLAEAATEGWSNAFVGATIGADTLDTWARGLERFTAVRARHDQAQFYDVEYADFVTDPIGTVEGIYKYFGLPLTEPALQAMHEIHAESRKGPRAPKHTYSLEDYGLTVAQVKARFDGLA